MSALATHHNLNPSLESNWLSENAAVDINGKIYFGVAVTLMLV